MNIPRIQIIGAGISGLSLAFWLISEGGVSGDRITIYEKAPRAGGWIQTFASPSGQLYEQGPRTLRLFGKNGASLEKMVQAAGLSGEMISASPEAARRYIRMNGAALDLSAGSFRSLLLNPIGRACLASIVFEPLQALCRKRPGRYESASEFIKRLFCGGSVALDIAGAYTSGIWAAQPEELSSDIVFPRLRALEARYGSVVLGAICEAIFHEKQSAGPKIISFRRGLGQFIGSLASWLEERGVDLRYNSGVGASSEEIAAISSGVCVIASDPKKLPPLLREYIAARTFRTPESAGQTPESAGQDMIPASIYRPLGSRSSLASVAFGWREPLFRSKSRKIKPSFGILSSPREDSSVLGIVMDSALFPELNSSMQTRVSVMIGGSRAPDAWSLPEDRLYEIAADRLKEWIGIDEPPAERFCFRAGGAIALPEAGIGALPPYCWDRNIYMASSAIGGVAIPDCIESARLLASELTSAFVQ